MTFPSTEYAAARVALLALRASVPAGDPPAVYRFEGSDAVLAPEEAARALAGAPKPTLCWAREEDDALRVGCQVLTSAVERQAWRLGREFADERGGAYAWLRKHVGDDYRSALALCVGRGERLVVPVAALEACEAAYVHVAYSRAADVPGSMWADRFGLSDEARGRGAAVIVAYLAPDERPYITDARTPELNDPAG